MPDAAGGDSGAFSAEAPDTEQAPAGLSVAASSGGRPWDSGAAGTHEVVGASLAEATAKPGGEAARARVLAAEQAGLLTCLAAAPWPLSPVDNARLTVEEVATGVSPAEAALAAPAALAAALAAADAAASRSGIEQLTT